VVEIRGPPGSSLSQHEVQTAMAELPQRLHILPAVTPQRTLDPSDPDPCRGCSDCCEYVAVPLDRPRTPRDFDEIIWFLLHRNVWVFIDEENDWFVQFNSPCSRLTSHRCGVYPQRPGLCRRYRVDECTTYGEGPADKYLFTSPDELLAYLRDKRPKTLARLRKLYPGGFPVAGTKQADGESNGVEAHDLPGSIAVV
jgi:Fe-S-cluster containining protein